MVMVLSVLIVLFVSVINLWVILLNDELIDKVLKIVYLLLIFVNVFNGIGIFKCSNVLFNLLCIFVCILFLVNR